MEVKYHIYSYIFSSHVWRPVDGTFNSWEDVEVYFKTTTRGHYKVEKIYMIEGKIKTITP